MIPLDSEWVSYFDDERLISGPRLLEARAIQQFPDLQISRNQIRNFKTYYKSLKGYTNSVSDLVSVVRKYKTSPVGIPDSDPFLFSFYEISAEGEVKVGNGTLDNKFHLGFTSKNLLKKLGNSLQLRNRGGYSVFQMDSTFKVNVNEFPLLVQLFR